MNNEIDFNYSECIKGYDTLGTAIYVNICNNETYSMPWGIGGWTLFSLGIMGLVFILAVIALFIKMIFWEL